MILLYAGFAAGLGSAAILVWLATTKRTHLWKEARIVYLVFAALLLYHSSVYVAVFLGYVHAPNLSESMYSLLLRPVTLVLLGVPGIIAFLHRWR